MLLVLDLLGEVRFSHLLLKNKKRPILKKSLSILIISIFLVGCSSKNDSTNHDIEQTGRMYYQNDTYLISDDKKIDNKKEKASKIKERVTPVTPVVPKRSIQRSRPSR